MDVTVEPQRRTAPFGLGLSAVTDRNLLVDDYNKAHPRGCAAKIIPRGRRSGVGSDSSTNWWGAGRRPGHTDNQG